MSKGSMAMSTAAVVITGGYLAYEQFGPKPKPAAPSAKVGRIGDTASGSNEGSAAPPSADPGSAAGSATASAAGSATGSAAGSATEPAPGSGSSEPGSPKVVSLEVPRLIGMTPEKATAELTRLGFRDGALRIPTDMICSYEDEKRDVVPIGTICNQERTAGTQLMSDGRMPVVIEYDTWEHGGVHAGNEWHRMPDLIGMPIAKARTVLRDHGFVDDEFTIGEARSSCGKGRVCEQVPKAGIRKYAQRQGDLNLGD